MTARSKGPFRSEAPWWLEQYIATFIGFLTIFAMWISLWDQTWRIAVEPTKVSICSARIGPSHCLSHSWIMVVDRGLSPDIGNGPTTTIT
jgi:hypothetical protein